MKKALLTAIGLILATLAASAQVEYVFLETRASYHGEVLSADGGTNYQSQFLGEYLNFHVKGKLTPTLSYHMRQRLTKPLFDAKNPLNATDIIRILWDPSPKWNFQFGKLPVIIGGYEWDDAPIDLYYYNSFCDGIFQVYALGGSVTYNAAEGQSLQMQFTQSLLADGNPDLWHANLVWYGHVASWWNTIWSVNFMDDAYHHHMGYVALGNRFEAGPMALELDGMYRRSLRQRSAGLDMSVNARLECALDKWTLFAKGGYDYNDACNVDPDGIAYDLPVTPGQRYIFGGGGVEYFPLGNQDVRLHAVAWANNKPQSVNFLAGITFRLHIVR